MFNEYSKIAQVAIRNPESGFVNDKKLASEWKRLRFHSKPNFKDAVIEFTKFRELLEDDDIKIIDLPTSDNLTIDSIYARDSILISPKGLILCNMGRASRTPEAIDNFHTLSKMGHRVAGQIKPPGTLEGGDFIWIDNNHAAVGLGSRTNLEGINQLKKILGPGIDLHIVKLPEPDHPEDVLHLMSIISPFDKNLALIYKPLMPNTFINWLVNLGKEYVKVSSKEYSLMGCNVLATAPRSIIMLENIPNVENDLKKSGCTVRTYKGDEISKKGEGGPTCLTRPLLRS